MNHIIKKCIQEWDYCQFCKYQDKKYRKISEYRQLINDELLLGANICSSTSVSHKTKNALYGTFSFKLYQDTQQNIELKSKTSILDMCKKK